MLRTPSMQELSGRLAESARTIAQRISRTGHRLWIVGGAPRDLALGREPVDVDVASAATPDEIEAAFEHTIPVGKAFGTIVIRVGGIDVQHTTFRSERGHQDARRPDHVEFGTTVEEDASRRDFTCNALYLDPLSDECVDPEHGLADLSSGVLRTVGDPVQRFAEDGLRLLRMARFAADLDLALAPGLAAAARTSSAALRGVSPERVLVELERMASQRRFARAVTILADCGLLERVLPGWAGRTPDWSSGREWIRLRLRLIAVLHDPPGAALGLAALLAPSAALLGEAGEVQREIDEAGAALEGLRTSRALRQEITATWNVAARLSAGPLAWPRRSQRIEVLRADGFEHGAALARAWRLATGGERREIELLLAERARLSSTELRPEPWIRSADLAALGIERGPAWGALLAEAEALQIDGVWSSRDEGLRWLAARAQEGGKTPRKA